jgi:hypothetical protein
MMRDAEIQKIADGILRSRLSSDGFLGCEARTEEDFDGASIIRVIAHVKESRADARARLDATMAIRAELEREDDNRFVYLDLKGEDADESEDAAADRMTRQ